MKPNANNLYGLDDNEYISTIYSIESQFDHEFYLEIYNDLSLGNIRSFDDAMDHYINIGQYEDRTYSYEHMVNSYYSKTGVDLHDIFDYEFYLEIYKDLGAKNVTTRNTAIIHYITVGHNESRIYSRNQMYEHFTKENTRAISELESYPDVSDKKFRILIRTSNRPKMFKKCIDSILNQTYHNYYIYICYDDESSLTYLKDYDNHHLITYFPIHVDSNQRYKFNLYCNQLLDKVNDGYIMFIDDDDRFIGPRVLELLNYNIGFNKIITWRFLRPDMLVYLKDLDNEIILGEIDTASVCFHHSLKDKSRWDDEQYGDYRFYKTLFSACPRNLKISIPYTLISTQFNNKIGNFGE